MIKILLVSKHAKFLNENFTCMYLPDGKSKDLLKMSQNEEEWIEYQKVMQDVVERSGLDQKIFYDIRGNHDNFGVPEIGGSLDFFSRYSISGRLQRGGKVTSVTIQVCESCIICVCVQSHE